MINYHQHVYGLLNKSGFNPRLGAENISIPCPLAPYSPLHKSNYDRKPSMGIKVIEGAVLVHCFTCGFKSRQLSHLYARLAYNDARWNAALTEAQDMEAHYVVLGISNLKNSGFVLPKPPTEKPLDEDLFEPYSGKFAPYLQRRGVTIDTGKRWGVGVDQVRCRALIPVRDIQGALWGGVGRSYVNEKPKYLNYWNMKKGQHLLGAHLIKRAATTVVVEGSIDALLCDQVIHDRGLSDEYNIVSILGSSVSKAQAKKLIACSLEVILALDADDAGKAGAVKSYKLLSKRIMTKTAHLSKVGRKDFGECTPEEVIQVITSANL